MRFSVRFPSIPQLSRDSEPPGQVTIVPLPIQVDTAVHNPNLTIALAGVGVCEVTTFRAIGLYRSRNNMGRTVTRKDLIRIVSRI